MGGGRVGGEGTRRGGYTTKMVDEDVGIDKDFTQAVHPA